MDWSLFTDDEKSRISLRSPGPALLDWSGHDIVAIGMAGMTTMRRVVEIIIEWPASSASTKIREAKRANFTISNEKAASYGYRPMHIDPMIRRVADANHA